MSELLIGALFSAPVWVVVGMFICSLCAVGGWEDEQRVWPEEDANDS